MSKRLIIKICKWFFGIIFGIVLLISGGLYFFKDEIIGLVMEEMNQHLKSKVSVSSVDLTFWGTFPNLSVDFNNVFIQDSYENSTSRDTLLYSDQIRLKLNPFDVWRENYTVKKIDIAPGTLQLKVNENGEVNYDIFKEDTTSTEAKQFEFKLEAVSLENIRFVYSNTAIHQVYSTNIHEMALKGNFSDQIFTLNAASKIHVNEARSGQINLIANKPVEFNIDIVVNQATNLFKINQADVFVAQLPFQVNGKVTADALDFHISGKNLALKDVANNFSMNQMGKVNEFEGAGNVYFQLDIEGEKSTTEPVSVNCEFGIANGQLTEPSKNQKIKNLSLTGVYSNEGGITKEFLSLKKINFTTAYGPFSGNLHVSHFNAPLMKGNAKGNLNLSMLHALFNFPQIDKINGDLGLDTQFKVQAIPQENETFTYDIQQFEGEAAFKNVDFQLIDDKRLFHQINGTVSLHNDQATLKDIRLQLGNSDLLMNGNFSNVVAYFKNEQSLQANISLNSKRIDIEDLGTTAKEVQIQEARTYMFPGNIDGVIDLSIGRLGYEGHYFETISSQLTIHQRTLQFPNLSFRNSGAHIQGSLFIEEPSPEMFFVKTQLSSSSIPLKQVFKEWNNFKQEVIREEHIFGNAAVSMYLEAPFDLRSGIIFKALKSEIDLKITDGRLKGVETFNSIIKSLKTPAAKLAIGSQNIHSLEKKLADLKFETLENKLIIRNGIIEIPKMSIKSSALNIETSGTHSFDNNIDYRFAFRFRDLKAQKDSEFGNIIDDGTGINVFMRMHGTMDFPIIEWDKQASKEERKEYNETEKANFKSMLKSDFGMYNNDTTVKTYTKNPKQKETIELDYGDEPDPDAKEKKTKDGKFSKWMKKQEEDQKGKKKIEVEFD